jgi:hypothetical protein
MRQFILNSVRQLHSVNCISGNLYFCVVKQMAKDELKQKYINGRSHTEYKIVTEHIIIVKI